MTAASRLPVRVRWRQALLDILLPPRCAGCRRRGVWFCADCRMALAPVAIPICPRCGDAVRQPGLCYQCRRHPPAFDRAHAAYAYDGPLALAIRRFKYGGERALAPVLGGLLADAAEAHGLAVDLIVPVPLHPARQRERGYNQSELLAVAVAARLHQPLDTALARTRLTLPQVGQSADARRANVVGAFAWEGRPLAGRRVLLIDDVCTTGATLDACARALRPHEAAVVLGLTLARG